MTRSLAQAASAVPIWNGNNRALAQTYLGRPAYPTEGLFNLTGHLNIRGPTYGWEVNASLLSVKGNAGPEPERANGGGMGGFYDLDYRAVYGTLDSNLLSLTNRQPDPIATLTHPSFGGARPGEFTVSCSPPLTPGQIARIRPGMWVVTSNAFRAAVVSVAPDGTSITVDSWSRGAGNWVGKGVVKGSALARPSDAESGPLTAWVHVQQSIGVGFEVSETHDVPFGGTALIGHELVLINNRTRPTAYAATNPLADTPITYGWYIHGERETPRGQGIIGNGIVLGGRMQRGYVAMTGEGFAYGVMQKAPGAVGVGFYSNQTEGQVLLANGGGETRVLIDWRGNAALAGGLTLGGPLVLPGLGVFADDAAAGRAGLPQGAVYRTQAGQLMVRH